MSTELDIALTHKYDPLITTRQQNLFTEEFFAGPDVSIYFNGTEMVNISQIQYTVQEQLKPIYGYDSMVFDDIAVGSRIVIGSFVMPIYNNHSNDSLKTLENLTPVKEKLPSWIIQEHSQTPVTTTQFEVNLNLKSIQSLLKEKGYRVKETGVMDEKTYQAITDFQRKNNISTVGEIDEELLLKLQVDVGVLDAVTSSKDLTLRISPKTTALICGTIKAEEPYIVLYKQNGWCYISSMSGIKGYAPSSKVEGVN